MSSDYITAADTAKMIRRDLARHWPAVKFYVRSQTYSGGASIDVYYDGLDHWQPQEHCATPSGLNHPGDWCSCGYQPRWDAVYKPGMPAESDVKAVAHAYAGGGFDGMIDLAYNVSVALDADGFAVGSRSRGTQDSHGSDPAWDTIDKAAAVRIVSPGADFVFVHHELPFDVVSKQPHPFRAAREGSRYCGTCGMIENKAHTTTVAA